MSLPIILTIAGSDSSGGAGIQADIKTISFLGGYAASVITAITAQNTLGVQAVHPLPVEVVNAQLAAVMDDLPPDAVKIGMVHNAAVVGLLAKCLQRYRPRFVVCDPVMISTSGRRLMTEETIQTMTEELFPLCTLITPNLSESAVLLNSTISSITEMEEAAHCLANRYHTSVLVKGGHLEGDEMCDVLCCNNRITLFKHPKIDSSNLHGTGCTLSSAIAVYLAKNSTLEEAIDRAKRYTSMAISCGKKLVIGHGNGPLNHSLISLFK